MPSTLNLNQVLAQQKKKIVTPKILKHNFVPIQNGGGSMIVRGKEKLNKLGSAPQG